MAAIDGLYCIVLFVYSDDSPDGQDTEPCTYTTVGTFTALVVATSYFETVNTTCNVIVQNPVTEEFVVSTNSPMDNLATDCEYNNSVAT